MRDNSQPAQEYDEKSSNKIPFDNGISNQYYSLTIKAQLAIPTLVVLTNTRNDIAKNLICLSATITVLVAKYKNLNTLSTS